MRTSGAAAIVAGKKKNEWKKQLRKEEDYEQEQRLRTLIHAHQNLVAEIKGTHDSSSTSSTCSTSHTNSNNSSSSNRRKQGSKLIKEYEMINQYLVEESVKRRDSQRTQQINHYVQHLTMVTKDRKPQSRLPVVSPNQLHHDHNHNNHDWTHYHHQQIVPTVLSPRSSSAASSPSSETTVITTSSTLSTKSITTTTKEDDDDDEEEKEEDLYFFRNPQPQVDLSNLLEAIKVEKRREEYQKYQQMGVHVKFSIRAAEDLYLKGWEQAQIRRVKVGNDWPCLLLRQQPFWTSVFPQYAKLHGLVLHDLEFAFLHTALNQQDTPESVHLKHGDVIWVQRRRPQPRDILSTKHFAMVCGLLGYTTVHYILDVQSGYFSNQYHKTRTHVIPQQDHEPMGIVGFLYVCLIFGSLVYIQNTTITTNSDKKNIGTSRP